METPDIVRRHGSRSTRYSLLARLHDWDDQQSWKEFFDTYWRLIGFRQYLRRHGFHFAARGFSAATLSRVQNEKPKRGSGTKPRVARSELS